MDAPHDVMAHWQEPGRRLSCRSLLGWSAAGTVAAAAGLATAWAARGEPASGRVLLHDVFAGNSPNRDRWNRYICDNKSNGWLWHMQPGVAMPSPAIAGPNGVGAAYDLPVAISVSDGLTLMSYRGPGRPDTPEPARSSARVPPATTSGPAPCTRLGAPTPVTCRSARTTSSCPAASHRRIRPAGTPRSADNQGLAQNEGIKEGRTRGEPRHPDSNKPVGWP
jgi:hypothetical protein